MPRANYIECEALLAACEPETEQKAQELVKQMLNGELRYLLNGTEKLVKFILLEQSKRAANAGV